MHRLADEQHRRAEAESRERRAEQERGGAQAGLFGQQPGGESGQRNRPVTGRLVEAHRQSAARRPDQIDLHDHRRRPGEALVDAEQRVGDHDPFPARWPDDEQRDRQADEPAADQHRLAPESVGECAGH
jgi:hypothetical protein